MLLNDLITTVCLPVPLCSVMFNRFKPVLCLDITYTRFAVFHRFPALGTKIIDSRTLKDVDMSTTTTATTTTVAPQPISSRPF